MTKDSVQIVEIQQPICGNEFGVSPCTATGEKCYKARATCRDAANYRHAPEWLLTASLSKEQGEAVLTSEIDTAHPIFAAFAVIVPDTPTGVIWEQGGATLGAYLGFTSGKLVWRCGDGSAATSTTMAKVSVPAATVAGKDLTFLVSGNPVANTATIWAWDNEERTLSLIGSDTASGGVSAWAGAGDGGVGIASGATVVGEDISPFSGTISRATFYDNTIPSAMHDDWRLQLFFSKGAVQDRGIEGAPFIRPSLASVSTSPTRINLADSSPDASGLGTRALAKVTFVDHPDTDKVVDPYLTSRTWNPFDRGSFWTKWLVRNKYRQNFPIIIYEGEQGQSLSEMQARKYFLSGAGWPASGGRVTLTGKDVLAYAEERKAQAPALSLGKLFAALDATATTFEVAGAEVQDYPASGTVRIDKETITYSAVTASANGITFTATLRGSDGTTAAAHDPDAVVQECLRYTDQYSDDICKDLLSRYALIPTKYMNLSLWESETSRYLSGFILSTLITEPTPVTRLVSELQRDVGFVIWWDDRKSLIDMRAIRGVDALPDTLSAEKNIIDGSFSITEKPRERITQMWIYYGPETPTVDLKQSKNYRFAQIQADLAAENYDEYGDRQIKTIKSRWINSTAQALSTASKTVVRYRDTPRECKMLVDVKDRQYWTGAVVKISHYLDVDSHGDRNISNWMVVSAEEVTANHTIKLTCHDVTLYGIIAVITPAAQPDYQGDGSDPYTAAFIGGADGLLSDGTPCARIT